MSVRVRYFAALRETTGRDEEELALPEAAQEQGASVADARTLLLKRYPALEAILPRCAIAINRAYVTTDAALHDGDELAFIPPLGGG